MHRYLVYALIFLLCVHNLFTSVNGCNPKKRPSRKKGDPRCVGYDCHRGRCLDYPCNACVGVNLMCHGYCIMT